MKWLIKNTRKRNKGVCRNKNGFIYVQLGSPGGTPEFRITFIPRTRQGLPMLQRRQLEKFKENSFTVSRILKGVLEVLKADGYDIELVDRDGY